MISSVGIITDGEVLDVLELDYPAVGIGEDNVAVGAVVSDGKVTETIHSGVVDVEGIGARAAVDGVSIRSRF